MSFRARVLLSSLVTLAVGLGALLVAGNVLLDRRVQAETSTLLRARAETELAALDLTSAGIRVRETVNDARLDQRAWVFAGGAVLESPAGAPPALDRAAAALRSVTGPREAPGPDDLRLLARPVHAPDGARVGTIVVAASTASLESLQHGVLIGSLVVAALVLLAGGLAIQGALRGVLRPIAEMTNAAAGWGAHDLERRFPVQPPEDELTRLAATLNGLLGRIAASRRHEQRFAGEVAHELRTPIAGLRGRAELALAGGDEAEREEALRAVLAATDRIGRTIDALMAAARRELGGEATVAQLDEVLDELGDELDVRAERPLPAVEGDPAIVRRALAPLLENARRHARSRVWLEVIAEPVSVRLVVRDDGPGVRPDIAERIFEPGVHDPTGDGAGLGLPLARRLAQACGGDVEAGTGPGGAFALVLPRA